jgi:hypothetical protein
VREGSTIIQRSYELIHLLEKNIIVGNLVVNVGQEERDISANYQLFT